MPLRIGFVTGEYPPMEGGVGAFTQALIKALATLGYECHIIGPRSLRPQAKSRRLRDLHQPIGLGYGQLHPVARRWRWQDVFRITETIIRYDLDVVNIQYQAAAFNMRSPAINLLPWRLRGVTKTAVTFHDLRVPYLFPKAGPLRRKAVQFMANRAHGIIVTNQADYNSLANGRSTPLPFQLAKIPIGSNIPTFTPGDVQIAAARANLHIPNSAFLLGYFGFLNESKGADSLVQVLAKLPAKTHLLFIGGQTGTSDTDNNQQFLQSLKAQIDNLGLTPRVHWTGFVSEPEVSTYLHAADLMVMPYRDGVSWRRGTLMAVLAHGRPLITTHPQQPLPELQHEQQAWLVPAQDDAALCAAIEHLQAAPTLRVALGRNARRLARQFSWQSIARKTADFLSSLTDSE